MSTDNSCTRLLNLLPSPYLPGRVAIGVRRNILNIALSNTCPTTYVLVCPLVVALLLLGSETQHMSVISSRGWGVPRV